MSRKEGGVLLTILNNQHPEAIDVNLLRQVELLWHT